MTPAPAISATLQVISGYVAVNRGGGARPVTGALELRVGDTVIARDGGSAVIVYQDGCRVQVDATQLAKVRGDAGDSKDKDIERSPCSSGPGPEGLGQVPAGFTFGAIGISAAVGRTLINGIGDANENPPASP